jgi:hypothetical protein
LIEQGHNTSRAYGLGIGINPVEPGEDTDNWAISLVVYIVDFGIKLKNALLAIDRYKIYLIG